MSVHTLCEKVVVVVVVVVGVVEVEVVVEVVLSKLEIRCKRPGSFTVLF